MSEHHARVILTANPHEWSIDSAVTDIQRVQYETFGINEVRALITEAHRHSTQVEGNKLIVVSALKMTLEAQHASLKILEEPPASSSIVLVLPLGTQLLPTVLSRVELEEEKHVVDSSEVFSNWKNTSVAERLQVAEAALKSKDTDWLQSFRSGLLAYVQNGPDVTLSSRRTLQFVTENLLARGASNKMLLEHLALSLPLTR